MTCFWPCAFTIKRSVQTYGLNQVNAMYGQCSMLRTRSGRHNGHRVGLQPRILDILILQDKTLFGAFEAGNIVCWLVNQPIAKLDLFKSPACRWICKTYAEYCYRKSATVRRLVRSPTLQSTIFCGVHSDLRGKGIRVSPPWYNELSKHLLSWLVSHTILQGYN